LPAMRDRPAGLTDVARFRLGHDGNNTRTLLVRKGFGSSSEDLANFG
jgi:hypothetical protein